ncbi:hypothetical protein, partial [[Kitasatospora] papulosa]|uniref:hypothetical protein n=1 Tax=[Kitasatospora] papulosa TaxID=1464011 RepID=UPI00403C7D30
AQLPYGPRCPGRCHASRAAPRPEEGRSWGTGSRTGPAVGSLRHTSPHWLSSEQIGPPWAGQSAMSGSA